MLFFFTLAALGLAPEAAPYWPLGLSFGVGGLAGTYTGARIQRYLPARAIEALLVVVILGLGLTYVAGFFMSS